MREITELPFIHRIIFVERVIFHDALSRVTPQDIRYQDWQHMSFLLPNLCEWDLSFGMRELGCLLLDKKCYGNGLGYIRATLERINQCIEQYFADIFSCFSKKYAKRLNQSCILQQRFWARRKYRVVYAACHHYWAFYRTVPELNARTVRMCLISSPVRFHCATAETSPQGGKWSRLNGCFTAAHALLRMVYRKIRYNLKKK